MEDIEVVSFDVGFTLIYPEPPVGHVYAEIASRFGCRFNAREIHARFVKTWKDKNAQNRRKRADNALADEARAYQWWQEIFVASIGDIVAKKDLEPMFKMCFEAYAGGEYWQIFPDVLPALTTLKEKGYRLVVLSNWDRRLNQTLKDLDLDRFFEKIYISTLIGHAKPDPGAFQYICDDLGTAEHAVLHIGDTLEEDVAGAQAAGIRAVYLDRREKCTADLKQIPTISSLSELLSF